MSKKSIENKVAENGNIEVSTTELVGKEDISTTTAVTCLMNPDSTFYCSIKDDGTRSSKVKIYNAVNNPEYVLKEHVNEVLEVVDVAAYPVELVAEETGEIVNCLRTILITKDGGTYAAVSEGVTNSLGRLFSIIGQPSWTDEPVKMKAKLINSKNNNGQVMVLELVE